MAKITGSAQQSSHFSWRRNSLVKHSCTGGGEVMSISNMAVQKVEMVMSHCIIAAQGVGMVMSYQCQSSDDNNQSEPGWEVWPSQTTWRPTPSSIYRRRPPPSCSTSSLGTWSQARSSVQNITFLSAGKAL